MEHINWLTNIAFTLWNKDLISDKDYNDFTFHLVELEKSIIKDNRTSAKDYLESQGINLNTTALITCIDGYLRQPNVCSLMENYHLFKLSNTDLKSI